jgi:NRAMP (natural resistance-associated macrophage protein)-like metal ion transporter
LTSGKTPRRPRKSARGSSKPAKTSSNAAKAPSKAAKAPSKAANGPPKVHPDRPPDPNVAELQREQNPIKRIGILLGPGLITGASDDDPSGIGTYAQAGAKYGFATLWTTLWMLPMMSTVQYICAKIGLVTGKGLAGVLRDHYPRAVLYPALAGLAIANTVNAGADIGAIAAAINLLVPIPAVVFVVPVTVGILLLQIFGSYRLIVNVFKWLALALVAYVGAALFARPDIEKVLIGTLVPTIRLDPEFIAVLVALLGTTISPYLFFWQANQEVEEQLDMGRRKLWQRRGASKPELRYALWDTLVGMFASEVVAYFIILATGATLFVNGQHDISSATDAAQALRPIAGDFSSLLLAVGLIGAGLLAVPVLTASAAYGVAEAGRWKFGLDEKVTRAPVFYVVIAVATLVGMAINFLGINPIDALVVSAVINGLLAAPLLILVMLISNNRQIMGARTNSRLVNVIGWVTAAVMSLAAVALIVTTIAGSG